MPLLACGSICWPLEEQRAGQRIGLGRLHASQAGRVKPHRRRTAKSLIAGSTNDSTNPEKYENIKISKNPSRYQNINDCASQKSQPLALYENDVDPRARLPGPPGRRSTKNTCVAQGSLPRRKGTRDLCWPFARAQKRAEPSTATTAAPRAPEFTSSESEDPESEDPEPEPVEPVLESH